MSKSHESAGVQTVVLESAKMFKDADGKLYRKLKASEAIKSPNLVRGETGEGETKRTGFYEPVTVAT